MSAEKELYDSFDDDEKTVLHLETQPTLGAHIAITITKILRNANTYLWRFARAADALYVNSVMAEMLQRGQPFFISRPRHVDDSNELGLLNGTIRVYHVEDLPLENDGIAIITCKFNERKNPENIPPSKDNSLVMIFKDIKTITESIAKEVTGDDNPRL